MKLASDIRTRLAGNRLRKRLYEMAELAWNDLATVYPNEVEFEEGKGRRVLFISPHPDDETFGAGGSASIHVNKGNTVTFILLSDGVRNAREENALRWRRRVEFQTAAKILGVMDTIFLDIPPAEIGGATALKAVEKLLIEKQPHVLYLPTMFDNHEEHRFVNISVSRALRDAGNSSMIVRAYEIWSPLPANKVADITDCLEKKRKAILSYTSQLETIDYEHHILGLNAYRALTLGGKARYAEAFLELPARAYAAMAIRHLTK